ASARGSPGHSPRPRARVPPRFAFTRPRVAAAAVFLVAVSAGLAWQLHPSGRPDSLHYDSGSAGLQARPDGAAGSADLQVRDGSRSVDPQVRGGGEGGQVRLDPVSLADAQ